MCGNDLKITKQVHTVRLNTVLVKPFATSFVINISATPAKVAFTMQTAPATELRVLSQPSGTTNITHYRYYVYQTRKSKDIYLSCGARNPRRS